MTTPEQGIQAQIKNIEATYGKTMSEWTELVAVSGKTKHAEIISLLKSDHRMTHGNANRVALVVRDNLAGAQTAATQASDPVDALFQGKKAVLRPTYDALVKQIRGFGSDVDVSPKRAYLSLRRRKQFAMIQPSADHVDVGLILDGVAPTARLEASGTFNAMFTHRVRVKGASEVDETLVRWLKRAYDHAG